MNQGIFEVCIFDAASSPSMTYISWFFVIILHQSLTSWWFQPVWNSYAHQIGSFPQFSGWKIPRIFELPPPILNVFKPFWSRTTHHILGELGIPAFVSPCTSTVDFKATWQMFWRVMRIRSFEVVDLGKPQKINMEAENTPVEKENHLLKHHFQVLC